jgi:hypothetical protein
MGTLRRGIVGVAVGAWLFAPAAAAWAEDVPKFLDLEVNPAKAYKQRAHAKQAASLSLSPGGKEVAKTHPYEDLVVVEESEDHSTVRVVMDNAYVRVAFYVDPQALPMVARKGATIVATPAATTAKIGAKTPGVRLRAGTPLTTTDAPANGAAHVTLVNGKYLSVDGYLPAAAFGRSFVPAVEPGSPKRNLEVPTPATVLDAPGGATLATIDGSGIATRLGPIKDGYVLVRFDESDAVVIGFVKADGVKKWRPGRGFGPAPYAGIAPTEGYGQAIHLGSPHAYRIRRGDLLYGEANGPVIGVALGEIAVASDAPDPDGYWALDVPGPYGKLLIYVKRRAP